ncbi:MAG: alanine dehydrogenase [Gammaproteobacteria bacterium]|nr:alanine dehydrogenase [Gammaproteobacteria bacterium]
MLRTILRKEHKNRWERRVALIPEAVAQLKAKGYPVAYEPSEVRIYPDAEYAAVGAERMDSPDGAQFVVGIKEPPVASIKDGQVHLAFSHVIKGQSYNMPLLQAFLDRKATLMDYEPITDDDGVRTIAFGRYAGIAGAADTFWLAGKKLALTGKSSPLQALKQTKDYPTMDALRAAMAALDLQTGEAIRVVVVGTGKVGGGAEEVCQWLNLPKVAVEDAVAGRAPAGSWYCVASSRHIHEHVEGKPFDYAEYVKAGKALYRSSFDKLLGKFDILLQTPFWTDFYPKHLDAARMRAHKDELPYLIGDISCDIDGSLECTHKASTIDEPAFTYDVDSGQIADGISWEGPTVMSIDNLPCELSDDASRHFSARLAEYLPAIMDMDLSKPFEECGLPTHLKRATIVYKGELTPNYQYLKQYL